MRRSSSSHTEFQQQGLVFSGALHFIMLVLVIFGLPELWKKHRDSLPVAMTVEILPIGQTNVKPKQESKPTPKSVMDKPLTALRAKSATQSNQPKPKPVVKKQAVPNPLSKKKPVPPKEKPKEEPKEQPKEEDLDAILKSVEKAAKAEQSDKVNTQTKTESKKAVFDDYNPSLPLAMSEIDAIRQQFMQCWNVPAGAKNAHDLAVTLAVRLNSDGSVLSVELAEGRPRYYTDTFFRAAADSAMRAVNRCSPLKNLPTDKYETWKFLELTFDPRDMLY
jgi:outer membrane biosynthesis protein TonB